MDFGLRDLDRDAEHVAAAEGVDADGRRRGTVVGDGRCLLMAHSAIRQAPWALVRSWHRPTVCAAALSRVWNQGVIRRAGSVL